MRWDGGPSSVRGILLVVVWCLVLCAAPVLAQEPPPYNPPYPFLKPPPDPAASPAPQAAAPSNTTPVPERVTLPGGTVLSVVLETPLSTRIAKKDQKVTFRTTSPVRLFEGIELPPDTAIHGTVIEAKKPGGFGKAGVIRVKIDQIELQHGSPAPLVARLQSAETDKQGRIHADNVHGTDMIELAQYTLTGVLLGSRIGGGKGAGIGAGAGALAALLIMMSRRGPDVYLEPGMPFVVAVDQPVELPGQQVLDAQESYAKAHPTASASAAGENSSMSIPPNERPVLKHRPKKP